VKALKCISYVEELKILGRAEIGLSRVGLGLKPNFFIYLVKPEPDPEADLILTYLINFIKPARA
jgi:hypothetical protein